MTAARKEGLFNLPPEPPNFTLTAASVDQALASLLGGAADELGPMLGNLAAVRLVWSRIRLHGIAMALGTLSPAVRNWPTPLAEWLADETRLQVLWEASHHACLCRVFARFETAAIPSLVMKGTAVAYLVYPDPAVRRRGDSDLLVREEHLHEVRAIFRDLGLVLSSEGTFGQETWRFDTGNGFVHCIDLHWEVAGAPFLRQLLDLDECFTEPVPLPRLAPGARAIRPVFLLLRGVINQLLHQANGYLVDGESLFEESRLIWQLDAHLLASRFSPADWAAFADLAAGRGLAAPCMRLLQATGATFGTPVPAAVLAHLAAAPQSSEVLQYMATSSRTARLRDDMAASTGAVQKISLFLSFAFPPRSAMRARYTDKPRWPLPLLYVHRIAYGSWRQLIRGHD